jgi:hypothetical protein
VREDRFWSPSNSGCAEIHSLSVCLKIRCPQLSILSLKLRLFAILKRMGKPVTLLEQLCGHAMSFGAQSFETERKDGRQRAFAQIDDARTRIANFEDSSTNARELRANLYAAAKKSVRTVIGGKVYILHVRVLESLGEDAFEVSIDPAPKLDPSVVPPFTAKQGQYLAFIYNYTKIHRQAPAESDLERYFQVSPPAIHDMIKTLERNGLIERTPGQARSIRLLVQPEHLPRLG